MTAPPGLAPATHRATSPATERRDLFLSPRIVAREAAKILAAKGMEVRPAHVRRLVTAFVQHGYTTLDEIEAFVLWYADPTGEEAVRRTMRGRS